jgi:hypothetical protein
VDGPTHRAANVTAGNDKLEGDILGLLFETELESVTPPEAAYLLDCQVAKVGRKLDTMAENGALVVDFRDGATAYRLPDGVKDLPDPSDFSDVTRPELSGADLPERVSRGEESESMGESPAKTGQIDNPPATARDARSRQVVQKSSPRDDEVNPGVSALLSFVVPGAGQLNNGEPGKGLAMFVSAMMMWAMLLGWIISVWSVVDAYERADRGE